MKGPLKVLLRAYVQFLVNLTPFSHFYLAIHIFDSSDQTDSRWDDAALFMSTSMRGPLLQPLRAWAGLAPNRRPAK